MTAVRNKHENTYKALTQLDAQYLHFDSLFLSIKSFTTTYFKQPMFYLWLMPLNLVLICQSIMSVFWQL